MSDPTTDLEPVAGWWAASSDADHEQVTLYRREGSAESLLDRFTVTRETLPTLEDFQLEVKRNFGGGEYVAVTRGSRGQFASRIKFAVAGLPKREKEPEEKAASSGFGELAALLLKQQEASEARTLAILEKMTAQPAGDPMDRALDMMVKIQKLQAPTRGTLEGIKEYAEFRAIMRDLAGDEVAPKSEGFADLLKVALPILGEVAKNGTELEKVRAVAALKREQLARNNPTPAAPPRPKLSPEMAEQLSQLLSMAGVMPADELAVMVADQLDAEQAQAVVDAIEGGDWLADLIEYEPRAKIHAEWLEIFGAKLVERLTDEPEPDAPDDDSATPQGSDAGTGEPGHPADVATDGGTSATGEPAPAGQSKGGTTDQRPAAKRLPRGSKSRTPVGQG